MYLENNSFDITMKMTCFCVHLICVLANVAPFKQILRKCCVFFKCAAFDFFFENIFDRKVKLFSNVLLHSLSFVDSELTNIQHKLGCLPSLPNLFVICKIANL